MKGSWEWNKHGSFPSGITLFSVVLFCQFSSFLSVGFTSSAFSNLNHWPPFFLRAPAHGRTLILNQS